MARHDAVALRTCPAAAAPLQVYKGLWNEVQDVAVKMVVGQSAEQQARFLREVRCRPQSDNPGSLPAAAGLVMHGMR